MYTYTAQHPSASMEIHKTSSQAIANSAGLIDSHWHIRKLQVLYSQTRGNWIYPSQKPGHEPSDKADLMTNAQAMQDPALAGEESQIYHKWET